MKISVIIPCRNEVRHIASFLDSLLAQELDSGCQLEILVADGMSDDGTREVLREYMQRAAEVRLIDNPGRIVSTGLNAAIRAATGEIIVRMDAHTIYARDYIRECVRSLEESGADNVGGPWVAEGRGTVGRAIAAAFQSRFCTGGGKSHRADYEGEVDTVYLGCWRREVFDRAGLFDPELVRNQDDEFNFRLKRAGGRIWQSPRIKSSYTPRASLRALFRQYAQYGFWKVVVIRKHRALASWRHAIPALFVACVMVGAVATLGSAAVGLHATAAVLGSALAGGLLLYMAACVAASAAFAGSLETGALLLMPLVIAIYHFAYGIGFLRGIFTAPRSNTETQPKFFTALTR